MNERERELAGWLNLIKGEYEEMPGLNLTKCQVRRLWDLDASVCDTLLDQLQAARFLRMTDEGAYVLAEEFTKDA